MPMPKRLQIHFSCPQKHLIPLSWVQELMHPVAIVCQRVRVNQVNHISFVYFGYDVKILEVLWIGLGQCLIVKSCTI